MLPMPRDPVLDATAALLLDPYGFIAKRCRRLGADVFETRILLQPTICLSGRDAAELFYDESRFVRGGAPPRRLVRTLFGRGAVQSLDGEAHRHRKRMLLSLVTPERIAALVRIADELWPAYVRA